MSGGQCAKATAVKSPHEGENGQIRTARWLEDNTKGDTEHFSSEMLFCHTSLNLPCNT